MLCEFSWRACPHRDGHADSEAERPKTRTEKTRCRVSSSFLADASCFDAYDSLERCAARGDRRANWSTRALYCHGGLEGRCAASRALLLGDLQRGRNGSGGSTAGVYGSLTERRLTLRCERGARATRPFAGPRSAVRGCSRIMTALEGRACAVSYSTSKRTSPSRPSRPRPPRPMASRRSRDPALQERSRES